MARSKKLAGGPHWRAVPLGMIVVGMMLPSARAQLSALKGGPERPISKSAPVTFQADRVAYDKNTGVVTASGHVEAWQNGHVLLADRVVIDRRTDQATAIGHVVIMEPSGQVVFAKRADLSHGMKDAVTRDLAVLLAQNGRLVGNGARRYGGVINEIAKPVYSTCDLCKNDPNAPPLWQIKARSAVEDLQHKVIEYHDAELQIYGFPVFYLPYLSQPDPSVRRQSGLLIPAFGTSTHIGAFLAVPYFWRISKSQDATIIPIVATKAGPVLDVKYRQAFNFGKLTINASAGHDRFAQARGLSDAIFSNGVFDLNSTWRAGFSYNRTSNVQYLNDFRYLPNSGFLASNAYIEGFGRGSYARIDAQTFQGLITSINQSSLPIVAPYARYDYVGSPDGWGGRVSFAASALNVFRQVGTDSRRVAAIMGYHLPMQTRDGLLIDTRLRLITAGYSASKLNQQPNFSTVNAATTARAIPIAAVQLRWPLERSAGNYGTQVIEPRVQLVVAPNYGLSQTRLIPNEDSLDLQFTDANLFSLNRFSGIDRFAGGTRVDYALQGAWYLPSGARLSGLVGQSYAFHKNALFPAGSGLNNHVSDIVARASVAPVRWLDFTYRTRLSHKDLGARLIDATMRIGGKALSVTPGYLYSNTNPYYFGTQASLPPAYFTPRKELTLSAATVINSHWSLSAATARNIQTRQFDYAAFSATWQNECAAFSLNFYRRDTSYNNDHGSTTVLFNITLKTLGSFGFSAL